MNASPRGLLVRHIFSLQTIYVSVWTPLVFSVCLLLYSFFGLFVTTASAMGSFATRDTTEIRALLSKPGRTRSISEGFRVNIPQIQHLNRHRYCPTRRQKSSEAHETQIWPATTSADPRLGRELSGSSQSEHSLMRDMAPMDQRVLRWRRKILCH